MPGPRIAPVKKTQADSQCAMSKKNHTHTQIGEYREKPTYRIVTILCPFSHPIFFASLMDATRLQALLEPRNRPSCLTR